MTMNKLLLLDQLQARYKAFLLQGSSERLNSQSVIKEQTACPCLTCSTTTTMANFPAPCIGRMSRLHQHEDNPLYLSTRRLFVYAERENDRPRRLETRLEKRVDGKSNSSVSTTRRAPLPGDSASTHRSDITVDLSSVLPRPQIHLPGDMSVLLSSFNSNR